MNITVSNPEPPFLPGDSVRIDTEGQAVLVGGECGACGARTFPRAPVCPACMSEDVHPVDLPRRGTLYSFTVSHVGPATWHKPFALGYVDLPDGVRVFSHLRGNPLRIGQELEVGLDEVGRSPEGLAVTSFVFRPVEE